MPIQIASQVELRSIATRVQVVRSAAGIEAWLLEDHSIPLISMTFGFQGGPAFEADGKAGTARMMGGLLIEGAGALDAEAFQLALAEEGSEIIFGVQRDRLSGSVVMLANAASATFALLGTALCEPHFTPEEIDRRRAAYLAQLLGQQSQPSSVSDEAFWDRGFRGHPYARPVGGRLSDLEAIGREDIVALHRELITRTRLRVAVVGAIDAAALAAELDRAFSGLPLVTAEAITQTALQGAGEEIVHVIANPQTSIYFGRPAIGVHDPDFPAALLMNHCLGGHPIMSRLAQELRETRGLCYAIGSFLDIVEGASSLVISTSTPNEHAREVIRLVRAQLERLVQDGINADEIGAARNFLIGSQSMEMDTSLAAAQVLLSMQFTGRRLSWLDQRRADLIAVTQRDVARVIERVIGDGSLLVSMAGGSQ